MSSSIITQQTIKKLSSSPCRLLSKEENELLFRIMGPKCQAQMSAVVQIYGTESPVHKSWTKRHCGVVTFTRDSYRRSYFIQVYDIEKEQKVFEQELFNQFSYHVSLPFFHQFEAENQMIGLNFADNEEADAFGKMVCDRLDIKKRKKEEKRRQMEMSHSASQNFQPQTVSSTPSLSSSMTSLNKTKRPKKNKVSKISKEQIGAPMNFQHITHVGFDEDKGFSTFNNDKDLDQFFKVAGVSQKLLQDDQTRKFIYEFIDKHGGIEKATRESKVYGSIKRNLPPPEKPILPARGSPMGASGPPPPPPPRPHITQPAPPPPPKDKTAAPERSMAPSPKGYHRSNVSPANPPPPPPPPRFPAATTAEPAPPQVQSAPVPPPPPPPPAPPIATMPCNSLQNPKARNDLLSQIRQKPSLNPVSKENQERPQSLDSRSNLMSEIRKQDFELKHVEKSSANSSPPQSLPEESSMAAMLAQALMVRAKVIGDSDSESDDEEDEWDDS